MSETTPTPWEVIELEDHPGMHPRVHSAEKVIAEVGNAEHWNDAYEEWLANAALIVTAVNAMEPMKEALRDLYDEANKLDPNPLSNGFHLALANARAALRLAEGEKE